VSPDVQRNERVRAIVHSLNGEQIVLHLPHTDYLLHLRLTVPAEQLGAVIGKRIKGTIEADALRLHPASGGGRFIEPVMGEPRNVAGTVLVADEAAGRVLVNAAAPIWLNTRDDQDFSVIREGHLINGHVQSGVRFIPADA
jgi:hypothetical protein